MTLFGTIVVLSLATLAWLAINNVIAMTVIKRAMARELRMVAHIGSARAKNLSIQEAFSVGQKAVSEPYLMATLWSAIRLNIPMSPDLLARVEAEKLLPTITRANALVQVAPAVGLLFTAVSISVGLVAAGTDPAAAAAGLIAVLPTALLSTVMALAMAIAIRMQIASTISQWQQLRAMTLLLGDRPAPPIPDHAGRRQFRKLVRL